MILTQNDDTCRLRSNRLAQPQISQNGASLAILNSKSQLFIHYPQSNIIRWPLMYFSWKDEIIYCFLLVRRCLRTSVGVVVFSFSFSDLYCDGHKSDGGGERGEAPRRPWHGSYQDPCCKVAAAAPGRFAAWQKGHPTPVQCPSIFQGNVTGH